MEKGKVFDTNFLSGAEENLTTVFNGIWCPEIMAQLYRIRKPLSAVDVVAED